jgi:hypothetical protein
VSVIASIRASSSVGRRPSDLFSVSRHDTTYPDEYDEGEEEDEDENEEDEDDRRIYWETDEVRNRPVVHERYCA